MKCFNKISLILASLLLFIVVAIPAQAQTSPKSVLDQTPVLTKADQPCKFTSASGLLQDGKLFTSDCTAGGLVAYINALNTFFYRLAIVLAVLMITIGGMQWLMAIGNSSRISNAKDTIQEAVIGLILALTAILLFNQIDTSFTELTGPTLPGVQQFECGKIKDPTSCAAHIPKKSCMWTCTGADQKGLPKVPEGQQWSAGFQNPLCQPGICEPDTTTSSAAADCSNRPALAAKYNVVYPATESTYIKNIKKCVLDAGVPNLDMSQIFSIDLRHDVCNYTRGNTICGECSHSVNSCHYGRREGNGTGAEAVDFNAIGGTETAERTLNAAIKNALTTSSCAGTYSNILFEQVGTTWHTHVSSIGCNGSASGEDLESN